MATALETIEAAQKKIRVFQKGQTQAASDSQDALSVLNTMLSGLKARGYDYEHTPLSLSDSLTLGSQYDECIQFMLAGRLAHDYGAKVSPQLAQDIRRASNILYAGIGVDSSANLPAAMTSNPSSSLRRW